PPRCTLFPSTSLFRSIAGSSEDTASMGGPSGSNEVMMFVSMEDPDDRNQSTIDFVEDIESDLKGVDKDADISVSTQAAIGGGDANIIEFTLSDDDTDRLTEAMDDIQEDLEDESEIRKVETSEEDKSPEMQIEIDEKKQMEHGLTHEEIAKSVDDIKRG